MSMWIMKTNVIIGPRTGLQKLSPGELHSDDDIPKRNAFDATVHLKLENSFTLPPLLKTVQDEIEEEWMYDSDDEELLPDVIPDDGAVDATGTPITPHLMCDVMIRMEIFLPQGEMEQPARAM